MTIERASSEQTPAPGLLERLDQGPVICAEGYLFELERRGFLQAGAFVPEVVLENPEVVRQLHREFVRAGSDVVEAFTYYGHREKLRVIGKEDLLEPLNREALAIAAEVARESGALFAGNICNTNVWEADKPETHEAARTASMIGSMVAGPRRQLSPTTWAPASARRAQAATGSASCNRPRSPSAKVMTAGLPAAWMTSSAASASACQEKVSPIT